MKAKPKAVFPDPPEHLSARASELWRTLGPEEARSLQRRTLFQVALEALDRADAARELLQTEGLVSITTTTGAAHLNPLVKVERESRQLFARIWTQLHLEWDSTIDGGNPF